MKKLFCLLILFSFLPFSVSAANDADEIKPFQIAKTQRLVRKEKDGGFFSHNYLLKQSEKRFDNARFCPFGFYKKDGKGECIPYCSGISCTNGNQPQLAPNGEGCCCN